MAGKDAMVHMPDFWAHIAGPLFGIKIGGNGLENTFGKWRKWVGDLLSLNECDTKYPKDKDTIFIRIHVES